MRNASLWRALLCVENTVVEDVEFDDEAQVLVVHVRPPRASRGRCGTCGSRASRYDRGQGRRQWRGLDMGTIQVFVEADAPRVNCPAHGPTVRQVPWARHGAGHTRSFDQQVAWLATQCSKQAITELMRIAWRTVGAIITRVWADTAAGVDAFAGLQRIGIDEISYKRRAMMSAPSAARLTACERPWPRAAPDTTATLLSSFPISSLSVGASGIRWSWSPGTAESPRRRTACRHRCSCSRQMARRRRRTFRR